MFLGLHGERAYLLPPPYFHFPFTYRLPTSLYPYPSITCTTLDDLLECFKNDPIALHALVGNKLAK